MATQPSPTDNAYAGFQDPTTGGSDLNALSFLFTTLAGKLWTMTLVQIQAVTNAGTLAAVGFCDVLPMVHQVNGAGQATPHGVIHNVPYFRMQGGADAVILDPKVGDIGAAIFASRDISAVKAAKAPNVPGSSRRFSASDALYIGGFLNGVPTQFIRFSATGIEIVSPTQIKLTAPDIQFSGPTHTTGAVTGDNTAVFTGNVTGQGTSLHTHTHSGVQTGSGNTGAPN